MQVTSQPALLSIPHSRRPQNEILAVTLQIWVAIYLMEFFLAVHMSGCVAGRAVCAFAGLHVKISLLLSFLRFSMPLSWNVQIRRWFHDTLVDADLAINSMMVRSHLQLADLSHIFLRIQRAAFVHAHKKI